MYRPGKASDRRGAPRLGKRSLPLIAACLSAGAVASCQTPVVVMPTTIVAQLQTNDSIAFTFGECDPGVAAVQVGLGTAASSVNVGVARPSIQLELSSPRNTDSRAAIGECGLQGRFLVVEGPTGDDTADGALTCDVEVTAQQPDGPADSYTIIILLTLFRTAGTAEPIVEVGSVMREYCRLDMFCDMPLPNNLGGGSGSEIITLTVPDLTFGVGIEYIMQLTVTGSINSIQGIPELGGDIAMSLDVSDVRIDYN